MVRFIIYYFIQNVKELNVNMNSKTKQTVVSALMAAIVCITTMIIKIPSPLKGYMNLGDCTVLLSGWILIPGYGFLAAGLGSALADVFSGYVAYAPATFIIKGTMALISFACLKLMSKKIGKFPAELIGGVLAETLMIFGYYVFEGFLYGFVPSLVNLPANAVQGIAGLVIGIILIKVLEKTKLTRL